MNVLEQVLLHQLENFFILSDEEMEVILSLISVAEAHTKKSLMVFHNKYFSGIINPCNSVMYCMFLYELSKIVFVKHGVCELADKVYYLNKALNAVDLYYQVDFPSIWSCEHPVGAVMGRAKYSDGLFFYQGCTVGGNQKNGKSFYPVLGKNLIMFSNSKILGDSHIGNNVIMSANSYIIDRDVPSDCIVFGQGKDVVIKRRN